MSDINISALPPITTSTDDDMFIVNDANAVTSIISWGDLTASIKTLTGQIKFGVGTANAPSITFVGDVNTGIYSPGDNKWAVSTGGVGRLFVDETGEVGVGQSSPSDFNSGANDLVIGATSSGDTGLTFVTNPNGDNIINFADGTGLAGAVGQVVYDHQVDTFTISTSATEALHINADQDIVIGTNTSDPNSKLTVAGGSVSIIDGTDAYPALNFRADLDTGISRPEDNNLAVVTGGAQRIVIDESGNLGIGLDNPLADIHINKPGATLIVTDSDAPGAPQARVNAGDGSIEISADENNAADNSRISMFVDGTELTRLVSTGEVIVPSVVVFNEATDDVTDPYARIGRGSTALSRGLDGELLLEADPSNIYPNSAVRIQIDGSDSFLLSDTGDVMILADGKIIFDADNDTWVDHPDADTVRIVTGGETAIRAESDASITFGGLGKIDRTAKRLLFGLTTPYSINGATHEFQLTGDAVNYGQSLGMFGPGTDGQYLSFLKSSGNGTIFGMVSEGDTLGTVAFHADNGSTFDSKAAEIKVVANGTVSAGSTPGDIIFSTTNANQVAPTERLRISKTGAIGIEGENYGSVEQLLTSNGPGTAPTWQDLRIYDISTLTDLP